MRRCSINWNNDKVQKSIDEYVEKKIPTQARLRQIISEHLQQQISEQALSIYLKRNGYSLPRRSPSIDNNNQINTDSNCHLREESSPLSQVIQNSSHFLIKDLKNDLSSLSSIKSITIEPSTTNNNGGGGADGAHPTASTANFNFASSNLFLSGGNGGGNLMNENFSTQHFQINNDGSVEPIFGPSSRYILTDSSPLSMVQRIDSVMSSQEKELTTITKSKNSNQQINWNDEVVQKAINEYFEHKIKLQTELRRVIMKQLNRNVSENSLRLYLKKLKNRKNPVTVAALQPPQLENFNQTPIKSDCQLSTTPNNASATIHPSATATILPNELYYLCNNFAASSNGLITNDGGNNLIDSLSTSSNNYGQIAAAAAASMIYVNSENVSQVGTSSTTKMTPLINSRDYSDFNNCLRVTSTPSTTIMMKSAQKNNNSANLFAKINLVSNNNDNNSTTTELAELGVDNIIMETTTNETKSPLKYMENFADEIKPSSTVRRRINWNDTEVQIAIQNFYDRKILTQAKLRSIIENILGEAVSEQALSIYLKRKKSRGSSLAQQQ